MVNLEAPRTHEMEVTKSARVFVWGPEPAGNDRVLVALHGYGQHPGFFMRRLEPLVEAGWSVVAPEGLHRFYVQGTSGKVGASWMTSEDRGNDIRDYLRYLDQMRRELLSPKTGTMEAGKIWAAQRRVLLGFSQGVPTAARWAATDVTGWDQLIFWSGIFPPDIDPFFPTAPSSWNHLPIDLVLGDQDPFFQNDHFLPAETWFAGRNIPYERHSFSGGHHLDAPLLSRLLHRSEASDD